MDRRGFLADMGMGCAGMALGSMLWRDGIARAHSGWAPPNGVPHHPPKAKSVIWVFLSGGISQMESFDPKPALNRYAGKTFTDMSGSSGISGHATFVGQNLYGSATSIAPGISRIWVYEAGSFAQGACLNFGSPSLLPATPPGGTSPVRIFNHSWIGSFGTTAIDNEVLRRADYAMQRDDTLFVVGENNGAGSARQPLMSATYNGIAVGL